MIQKERCKIQKGTKILTEREGTVIKRYSKRTWIQSERDRERAHSDKTYFKNKL